MSGARVGVPWLGWASLSPPLNPSDTYLVPTAPAMPSSPASRLCSASAASLAWSCLSTTGSTH